MCNQQSLRLACTYMQSDQSLRLSLDYSMSVQLLTEHPFEFLSLNGGCTGSSVSTYVKIPHCWKSDVTVTREQKNNVSFHQKHHFRESHLSPPPRNSAITLSHLQGFLLWKVLVNCLYTEIRVPTQSAYKSLLLWAHQQNVIHWCAKTVC